MEMVGGKGAKAHLVIILGPGFSINNGESGARAVAVDVSLDKPAALRITL
jgi:hypothetical protein